ncbi:tyrosine-type recombinase/integrase [uncultured Corynebacterium sp.]|uniref:site-specific integrase n=1 Tax=uncultured Corynebacterium sp. TaxID=159447 RepID=UPI0026202AE1|nr:tyrosine-type recombinase/integrase [uncultured Corynebacterium sp.]
MMTGRPRTPIGTWGDIAVIDIKGRKEARARFRFADGKLRLVSARGATTNKAKAALRERLATLSASVTAENGITRTTTISELTEYWLERKTGVEPQTIDDYRQTINASINPVIGEIRLEEITPGRISTVLEGMKPSVRIRASSILHQSFAAAVAHDAISTNPVASLPKPRPQRKPVEVITIAQLVHLRKIVEEWAAGRIDDAGNPKKPDARSEGRAHDLLQFFDLLLATGCRTGELAAVRWCDVDMLAPAPTMLIAATMVRRSGEGLVRQAYTKTKNQRVLTLPPYAVQILAVMQRQQIHASPLSPIFPSSKGTFREPTNINKQWRRARHAAGMDSVQFRTLRRTVATLIDREIGDEEAAAQLGHSSVSMTRKHYIAARAAQAPDLTSVLEKFA